ncbi:Hypothetical protein D9617_1g084170 [Elsinoe fawcettii]|nr:Hypothetical protein D9617_1g084170 [Elsinoe fawcettii]
MLGINPILTLALLLVCTVLGAPGKIQYNSRYNSAIGSSRDGATSLESSRRPIDPAKASAVEANCATWTNGVCTAHMGRGNILQVTDNQNVYGSRPAAAQANQDHRTAIDAGYRAQQASGGQTAPVLAPGAGPAPASGPAPAPAPGAPAPGST